VLPTKQDLPRTAPEAQGVDSSGVLKFVETLESQIQEIHSFMLLRHGNVIAEGWWNPYQPEHPHMMFSVSKSFTSTAVGLAIHEGYFSVDDPILSFFPDTVPHEINDFWAAMQVRHLLSMSTGQAEDTWAYMVSRPDGNWIQGFFDVPVLYEPGTHFLYNTGATYMLSAIVQKTTGQKVLDFLEPRLFEPLGIENATWFDSPEGITAGGIGLSIRTEDLARFGQLYLQQGNWQGKQLLPATWVQEATSFQVSNASGVQPDWSQGYGYQFWRCRHNAYRGDGVFGQYCIVLPEQDAVLAITGGVDVFDMQQPLDILWENLLPAMQANPLPENVEAQHSLANKLSSLSLMPIQGQLTSSIATQVSGQTYIVDANDLNIETLSLNFTEAGCTAAIETSLGEETISCGYRDWQNGQTTLFQQPLLFHSALIATSGAWTAENTFTMVARLYESPFYHTLNFHFFDGQVMVEVTINVSLESLEPILLTAHLS